MTDPAWRIQIMSILGADQLEQHAQKYNNPQKAIQLELIEALIKTVQEQTADKAIADWIKKVSTDNRPLGAKPLIKKMPVPCPRCGAEEYADWTLWPHQVYNSIIPDGAGHYCFPCFATITTEAELAPKEAK